MRAVNRLRAACAASFEAGGIERVLIGQGRRLADWLPVGWACGSLLFLTPRHDMSVLMPLVALLLGMAILVTGWRSLTLRTVAFVLVTLAGGCLDARWETMRAPPMPALPTRATILSARIAAIDILPADAGKIAGRRLVLRDAVFETGVDIGMKPMRRTLRVKLKPMDDTALQSGQRVRLRAMLRPIPWPSRPGGRDLQREAWFSGLGGNGYALNPVVALDDAPHGGRDAVLRARIAGIVHDKLDGQTAAIAATLLAGAGSAIDRSTRDSYAAAGLAHILAVAGLHLGLVMAFTMVAVRALLVMWPYAALRWPCREIAAVVAFLAGIGYVVLTGAHLPALRSLGMAAIVTLALTTGRRALSMRTLSLVALAILIIWPSSVLDVSFQMSFAAVMALIAGYDALRGPLTRLRNGPEIWRRGASHLVALALTSLLAGAATLPVSLAHFGAVQPWFVLANMVAVPVAALVVMPAGVLALLAMPLHASGPFLSVMGWGIDGISALAHAVATLRWASTPAPQMPGWGLAAYLLALTWLCLWRGRIRLLASAPVVLAMSSPWLVRQPDLLVSPDAGLMAFNHGDTLFVGAHSSLERSALDDWQRELAAKSAPLASLPECSGKYCRVTVAGWKALLRPTDRTDGLVPPPRDLCAGVAVFVSATPARDACRGAEIIDRFSVWRNGAYAVWLEPGRMKIVSDRDWRGVRPWVPRSGSRGMPNLPLAQSE